ncbi:MAG: head GIN domain-containing protein [Pseudomonadota bacterium]
MRFLVMLAALPLVACGSVSMGGEKGDKVAASGGGASRTFQVADFTGVELAGADDIDVTVGGTFSVRAEGPAEELDKLEIRKDGTTLWVGRRKDGSWSAKAGKGVKVHVTMPAIRSASLAGAGDLTIDKVESEDFDGNLAGSGDLKLGRVAATSVELNIAGSGTIAASGQVERLEVAVAGSGDVDAAGLKAARADVSIAGSGSVAAEVNGPAKINILGSGDVTLGGKPQCETSKMGSGDVTCG